MIGNKSVLTTYLRYVFTTVCTYSAGTMEAARTHKTMESSEKKIGGATFGKVAGGGSGSGRRGNNMGNGPSAQKEPGYVKAKQETETSMGAKQAATATGGQKKKTYTPRHCNDSVPMPHATCHALGALEACCGIAEVSNNAQKTQRKKKKRNHNLEIPTIPAPHSPKRQ